MLGDSEQNKTRKCPIHYSNHSLNKGREFLSYQFETVRSSYVTTDNTDKDCQAAVRVKTVEVNVMQHHFIWLKAIKENK